ncbi:hypothetical protein EMIT074MI3_10560 [Bacillus licheniformis]
MSIYDLLSREAVDEREGFTREIGTKKRDAFRIRL